MMCSSSKPLRPHQERAIGLLRESLLSGKRRPILQAPTGSGKTVLAANVIRMAQSKGNRVVFCVPSISLIDQTVQAFWAEGIRDVGVIQGDHPMQDWSRPVQIASVQTLARRQRPNADLVIVDEAHQQFKIIRDWMAERPELPFIGLSATPWARGLGQSWDDLLIVATTAELIEAGFLSPYQVYAPTSPDLSKVRIRAGDYADDELSLVMRDHKLVGDVVASWVELGSMEPTLCFCVDRAHAKAVRDRFNGAGYPFGYCDAYTTREERGELFRDMQARRILGIVNVGTLTTGVDADVRTLILARPTKSPSLFVQIIGRALRTAPGKQVATIIDHTDTTLRLGLPCSIHRDKLDDGAQAVAGSREAVAAAPALPKACPKCKAVKPPKVHECPQCGFKPEFRQDVDAAAGSLAPIGKGGAIREWTMAEKQAFYSGLLHIQKQRGRNPGWVAHSYRDKFGVWPRGLDEVAKEPAPEVAMFVKAKDIRFAKRQGAGR